MEAKLLVLVAFACAVSCVRAGTVSVNVTLQAPNITRSGCGTSKMCLTSCDPATSPSSCFYASTQQSNSSLVFELSGGTTGYVALGLSTNLTQGASIVFVCGNSNASSNSSGFIFLTASNSANGLNLNTSVNTVNSIQGIVVNNQTVNKTYIQCVFSTSVNLTTNSTSTSTKSSSSSYYVSIFSGVMNGDTPGSPNTQFNSTTLLDLTDPKANTANSTSSATTAPSAVTAGSDSLFSPVARALSILLSAVGLLLLY
ncbi:putative ferric-chelate reductase 1 [Astyanax mexicanus]|uniref:Putative ferric-chelate reductase 1 n=1 Tax=Astyanax mexicanus TaxID=7994 RepID=A0A8T2LP53_ASTMX|nr:putative ferric-chelate reductase 1 [Astyanax mexicanus]